MDYDSIIKTIGSQGSPDWLSPVGQAFSMIERKKKIQELIEEAKRQQEFENNYKNTTADYNRALTERVRAEIPLIPEQKASMSEANRASAQERLAKAQALLGSQEGDILGAVHDVYKGDPYSGASMYNNIAPFLRPETRKQLEAVVASHSNEQGQKTSSPLSFENLQGVAGNVARNKGWTQQQITTQKEEGADRRHASKLDMEKYKADLHAKIKLETDKAKADKVELNPAKVATRLILENKNLSEAQKFELLSDVLSASANVKEAAKVGLDVKTGELTPANKPISPAKKFNAGDGEKKSAKERLKAMGL